MDKTTPTNADYFHAVSFSGGKDSTAMLLLIFQTEMEMTADEGRKAHHLEQL